MKQTAVEYLIEQLSNYDSKMIELFGKEINKAKEIEKKQIIDACNVEKDYYKNAEHYYKETFNK
jgi:hypothetical protein